MNIYDFDKTIYKKDSTVEFYKYCLKKNKRVLLAIPGQIIALFLYIINIYNKRKFKESFFSFLKHLQNVDELINLFWKSENENISEWYISQKSSQDIIISASPDFLLAPIKSILGIERVIATEVDKKTGKFLSENCYGEEKINRFYAIYGNREIDLFYSDSLSDTPMALKAKKAFIVDGNVVTEWNFEKKENFDFLETVRYVFWGGITTLINLALFALFVELSVPYTISNITTYFIAVVISYFLNKKYVFEKADSYSTLIEVIEYFAIRFFSISVETLALWISVDIMNLNVYFAKIAISVVIIVGTYILNKIFVFKKIRRTGEK